MLKVYTFLVVCCLWQTFGLKAQDTIFFHNGRVAEVGQLDAQAKRQGQWRRYFLDSKEYIVGHYKNGVEEGPYTIYQDTILMAKGSYVGGKLTGPWQAYHQNGVLKKSGQFIDGRAEGIWKTYNERGELERIEYYHLDALNGEWTQFFENRVHIEGHYENNLQTGLWRNYHPNGQLAILSQFNNGQYVGMYYRYANNGTLLDSGRYEKGLCEGAWVYFRDKDTTLVRGTYKGGEHVGTWREYYATGQLKTFVNGEAGPIHLENGYRVHGDYITFFKNGQVHSCEYYWHGKAQGIGHINHPTGCEEHLMTYQYGELTHWQIFYPNGFLKENKPFKNGQLHGWWFIYYPSGQLQYATSVQQGVPNGMQYEWWPNGQWSKYGPVKNGRYHGHWKIFNKDGSLYVEGEYVNGEWRGE